MMGLEELTGSGVEFFAKASKVGPGEGGFLTALGLTEYFVRHAWELRFL